MSQENVEIVRQGLAATSDGDPGGGQVGEFLRMWAESWQDWHFDVTDLRDGIGDRVFAGIHEWGIGAESEVSVDQHRYLIFTVRSDRITRVQMFSDRAEGLEAAGLRE
jgi:hypothetical protein